MALIQTERLDDIENLILERKIVRISHLVNKYKVSSETIRRDLSELEKRGLLQKVHGGAVLVEKVLEEPPFQSRQIINLSKKKEIAKAVSAMVNDGESLVLDVGTTVQEIAKCLINKTGLFIITNSSIVAEILSPNKTFKIFLLGGEIRPDELSTHGPFAIEQIQRFKADKAILGAGGITEDAITDFHFEEAILRREMISQGKEVIFAIDSSKFGVTTLHQICNPFDANKIVTDTGFYETRYFENAMQKYPIVIAERLR